MGLNRTRSASANVFNAKAQRRKDRKVGEECLCLVINFSAPLQLRAFALSDGWLQQRRADHVE
jgi:hypothetical protein